MKYGTNRKRKKQKLHKTFGEIPTVPNNFQAEGTYTQLENTGNRENQHTLNRSTGASAEPETEF